MKRTTIFLSYICLIAGLAFAGGETGNGHWIAVETEAGTGNIVSVESSSLYQARTDNQIEIQEVQTENEAISQATSRLSEIDDEFLSYFNEALLKTQNPGLAAVPNSESVTDEFVANFSTDDGGYSVVPHQHKLVDAVQFDDATDSMKVFPIYNNPKLSTTSRAALKIEGAIYLLTREFLPLANETLAGDLMVLLMAKTVNASEISRLTHEILTNEMRGTLFPPPSGD